MILKTWDKKQKMLRWEGFSNKTKLYNTFSCIHRSKKNRVGNLKIEFIMRSFLNIIAFSITIIILY